MSEQTNPLESLKATYDNSIAAFNALDLDSYHACMHEDITYLYPAIIEPLKGKASVQQWYKQWLENIEAVDWAAVDPYFLVVNHTGIVFSQFTYNSKYQNQAWESLKGQHTVVFVQIQDRWWKLSEHFCAMPE